MFAACADPKAIEGLTWLACYLTSGKHLDFYWSFVTVLALAGRSRPRLRWRSALAGAMAARSQVAAAALDRQGLYRDGARRAGHRLFPVLRDRAGSGHRMDRSIRCVCPDWTEPVWQGLEFHVCPEAKVPSGDVSPDLASGSTASALAVVTFAIVFGAFAANVLYGAMQAVPRAQLETGESLWHVAPAGVSPHSGAADVGLCAARPVEPVDDPDQGDAACCSCWASRTSSIGRANLGGTKTQAYEYPASATGGCYYFLGLLVFYLLMTKVSEIVLGRLSAAADQGPGHRRRRSHAEGRAYDLLGNHRAYGLRSHRHRREAAADAPISPCASSSP